MWSLETLGVVFVYTKIGLNLYRDVFRICVLLQEGNYKSYQG